VLELAVPGDALAFSRALQRRDPPVHLSERRATNGLLTIDPLALQHDDDLELIEAICAVSRDLPRAAG
jgi:hypothetical protein